MPMAVIIPPLGAIAHTIIRNNNAQHNKRNIISPYPTEIIVIIHAYTYFGEFYITKEDTLNPLRCQIEKVLSTTYGYAHSLKISSERYTNGLNNFMENYIKQYETSAEWASIKEKMINTRLKEIESRYNVKVDRDMLCYTTTFNYHIK